jgi:hypothetical protein
MTTNTTTEMTQRYRLLDPEALRLSYTCDCGAELALNADTEPRRSLDGPVCAVCKGDLRPFFNVLSACRVFLQAAKNLPSVRFKVVEPETGPPATGRAEADPGR